MGKAQEKREAAEKAAAKKAEKDAKKAALKEARAAKKALKAQVDLGVPLCRDTFTSFKRVASGNDGTAMSRPFGLRAGQGGRGSAEEAPPSQTGRTERT